MLEVKTPTKLIVRTHAESGCSGLGGCIPEGLKVRVIVPAIDASLNEEEALGELRKLVAGKDIRIYVTPIFGDRFSEFLEKRTLTGEIHVDDGTPFEEHPWSGVDVTAFLLRKGMARYADSEAYVLSSYHDCLYRIDEREARQARIGIWAKEETPGSASILPWRTELVR